MQKKSNDIVLSTNIRKIRNLKGLSQEFVAKKLHLSQAAYSKIEQGKTHISEVIIEKVAAILEVNKEALENFSESTIFNNCNQNGIIGNGNTFSNDFEGFVQTQNFYEKIIKERNLRIRELEKQLEKMERKMNKTVGRN